MATEILKSFSHLQSELEEAKNSLKGVDENIKRLIGRDPSELPPRLGQKRPLDDKNSRQPFSKFNRGFENDDVLKRRNPNAVSVFKRLSDKVPDESNKISSRGLISKVIAAPKEVPSRQAVLDKQNGDEKFKARNRRMFGALLGTLQRFQQEESKLKKREQKRTQIEKKIEEHEQQEKEEIKKERQELFLNRKKKQQEIKMIELKMLRMKEYAAWEQSQRPRTNFIITKAKPHIHYLPRKMDDKSKELLEKSKKDVEEQIENRRQAVYDELSHIEERMKRNFEVKNHIETKEEKPTTDRHDRHRSDSEGDDDAEIQTKPSSPEPKDEKIEDEEIHEEVNTPGQEEPTPHMEENGEIELNVENGEVPVCNTQTNDVQQISFEDEVQSEQKQDSFENHVQSEQSAILELHNENLDSSNKLDSSDVNMDDVSAYSQNSAVTNVNIVLTNNENEPEQVVHETI